MKFKIWYSCWRIRRFYNYCSNELNLNVIGLMIIPPIDQSPDKYFRSLDELNKSLALENLSMGMSADYTKAVKYSSTFVRIGSSSLALILTLHFSFKFFNIKKVFL